MPDPHSPHVRHQASSWACLVRKFSSNEPQISRSARHTPRESAIVSQLRNGIACGLPAPERDHANAAHSQPVRRLTLEVVVNL